ncbi:MAG: nucleoside hydrolase [Bacteroidales bacterium]|nr:nucleoside hydrolase [Bacteroidales bacterium]
MKRFFLMAAAALTGLSLMAQRPQGTTPQRPDVGPRPQQGGRVKVIVDNDLCGDGDGLFHLFHQLLCTSSDVRGIVGAHVGARSQAWGQSSAEGAARNNAEISVSRANEIIDIVGKTGQITVKAGAPGPMADQKTPVESEGARLIIEEAKNATPERPLYLLFGGPLTDIASAWLMDPSISKNVILVWIGGQEYPFGHPFPPQYFTGNNLVEYNLRLDVNAAKTVFNDSDLTIWQIPRDVYRQSMYSMAELEEKILPLGKIGEYLGGKLGGFARMADTYVLGDSPLCLISTLTTTFEPGAAGCFYEVTPAPTIVENGLYDFTKPGRDIIVYKSIDTRLEFGDMESRFRLHAAKEGK